MKVILIIILLSLSASCTTDYEEDLGYGYIFAATNRYNHYIVKDGRMIVDSNILKYGVFDIYAVGYREEPVKFDINSDIISKRYGYFILNLVSVELLEGFSEKEYLQKIKLLGIPEAKEILN